MTSQNNRKRILVVDDEPDIILALKTGLEDLGPFSVDAFSDPELAPKNFKPDHYALVLIDIVMPKMDGFELCESLKKKDPDLNVCFLTASEVYREEMRGSEHCALNNDQFLRKPITFDDLIKDINRRINRKFS